MLHKSTACPLCKHTHSQQILASSVQMQKNDKIFYFHKCLNCFFIFLSNPPNKNEMNEYYGASYLPYLGSNAFGKYHKFVNWGQRTIDKKRAKIVINNCKKIDENFYVLDFGCGKPSFLKTLQIKTNTNCIGYDLYFHGWKNESFEYENINLISGEIKKLSFIKKFNLITLWHTLEHEFQPNNLIHFFNKITTNDATLIVEVPNYNSITRKIQNKY